MLRKRRLFAAIAGLVVMCTAGQAHAQYPPCTLPTLIVDPSTGPAGFTFAAIVTNCRANEPVTFLLGSQRTATTCNPVTLQASATLSAPTDPGPAPITAELRGVTIGEDAAAEPSGFRAQAQPPTCPPLTGVVTLSATLEVLTVGATTTTTTEPSAPTTTIAGGNIPTTGSSGLGTTSAIGMVLLAVGVGLFVVARLRRRPAPSA